MKKLILIILVLSSSFIYANNDTIMKQDSNGVEKSLAMVCPGFLVSNTTFGLGLDLNFAENTQFFGIKLYTGAGISIFGKADKLTYVGLKYGVIHYEESGVLASFAGVAGVSFLTTYEKSGKNVYYGFMYDAKKYTDPMFGVDMSFGYNFGVVGLQLNASILFINGEGNFCGGLKIPFSFIKIK